MFLSLFLPFYYLLSMSSSVYADFILIECSQDRLTPLLGPVHLDIDNSDVPYCLAITDVIDTVIEPSIQLGLSSRVNGSFLILADSSIDLGQFAHRRRQCNQQPQERCDQLIFRIQLETSGKFVVQYRTADGTSFNITIRFSTPGIYFENFLNMVNLVLDIGDNSTSVDLIFELWTRARETDMVNVCSLQDGVVSDSTMLKARPIRVEDTICRIRSGQVAQVPIDIKTLTAGVFELFLTQQTCRDNATRETLLNLTVLDIPPITTPTTTSETTSTMETTTQMMPTAPPTTDDVPVAIIASASSIGGLFLVCIIGACIMCCVCIAMRKKGKDSVSPDHDENNIKLQDMKSLEDVEVKMEDETKAGSRSSTNDYVTLPPTPTTTIPSIEPTRVAFVTASDSPGYESLKAEIEIQHSCKRVQPVAMIDAGSRPTLDEYCCGIARLLKQQDCLVYIVWSGALENFNGNNWPPIKKLLASLAHRPLQKKDQHGTTSVMHRLIFVQLGSKGNVKYRLSNQNNLTFFWEFSAEDASFDAKQCAQAVCGMVKDFLKGGGSKHVIKDHVGSSSALKTGQNDNLLLKSRSPSADCLDSAPDKQSTVSLDEKAIAMLEKTIVDTIDGKLDKVATKEDVKELKDDVGYIAEKVTENSIQKNEDQDQY